MELSVRQFVKLKEYQEQRIRELWCEQQQEDVQQLIDLMEEVATVAFDATKSSQGYAAMKVAKANFIASLISMSERYRLIADTQTRRHTDT